VDCNFSRETVKCISIGKLERGKMGRKQEKAAQRKQYKESFKAVKHGHGGRAIKKKQIAAYG